MTNSVEENTQKAIKKVTKHIIKKYDAKGNYEEGLMARCNQAIIKLRKIQQRKPDDYQSAMDKEVKSCFSDFGNIIGVNVSFIERTYRSYLEIDGDFPDST